MKMLWMLNLTPLQKFKHKFIGNWEFYKKLLILIIPIIIQQGITNFVSLLDNVMVGRLGTESMSGVAIVNQLLFVFNITIFGGLSGASIYGAQYFGKGDHDGVRYAFRFKIVFSAIIVGSATLILLFFKIPLISLFLSESDARSNLALTLSEAHDYLIIMLIGLAPFAISQTYASSLRENGETVSPMIASALAIGTNLILNYILIFGKFGVPALGVEGAAIGTVISRYIEVIYLIFNTQRQKEKFPFIKKAFHSMHIPKNVAKSIIITGMPLILNEILWSIGTTMITQSYSTRGLQVVAAINITLTVWNLFCIVMFAMGNAVSIIIGQLLGSGEIAKAKDTDNKLIFFTVILHIGIGILIALSAPFIPLIYNTEQEVRTLTTYLLFVAAAALPIQSMCHVMYFTIRSGGKTFITFLFDCVFTWVVALPIAFYFSRYTELHIVLIYASVQFSEVIKVMIGLYLLRSGIWANNMVSNV